MTLRGHRSVRSRTGSVLRRQPSQRKIAPMSIGIKRVVGLAAIYAIALQTILFGVAPVAGFGSIAVDPFFVICRSDSQSIAANAQTDGKEDRQPGKGCEHCTLCNTAIPPLVPFAGVGFLVLFCIAIIFCAIPSTPCVVLTSGLKLARGPPQIVLT